MRYIETELIKEKVQETLVKINFEFDEGYIKVLENAFMREEAALGKEVLKDLLENAKIALNEKIPICQDTGMVNVYIELGQDVTLKGRPLHEAVNEAVKGAYKENYLRPSIVEDPISRKNTGDNTPAIIHFELVSGEKVTIFILAKGGGSEQICHVGMLSPHQGIEGVKEFVLSVVKEAGPNPCPPVILGVGIGGNFDYVAYLAKKALLRSWGERHPDPFYADIELELISRINELGLGPGGLGGKFYVLDVRVATYPTHIAQLPVAVAFNCNAFRIGKIEI
ncbi:MAG TPA: fumarate hydratase [Candidatus Hydrothermia bacterium]|nr:fumarate hydratase [Candidatus Hydrothermae bacterium]MDD3648906.1 fumarate hydratase [Candidatus Hydrothermia bacterium]MDD5572610.1 fumarate hydratase [Candidatus Hydrothermia bacterium]HOK23147.1 fumarate hydratase [Candidatus Hydrothermia bacterium]HOL23851.1 fumarate hydratase [Candidatus Hydrothermia bacterium]